MPFTAHYQGLNQPRPPAQKKHTPQPYPVRALPFLATIETDRKHASTRKCFRPDCKRSRPGGLADPINCRTSRPNRNSSSLVVDTSFPVDGQPNAPRLSRFLLSDLSIITWRPVTLFISPRRFS